MCVCVCVRVSACVLVYWDHWDWCRPHELAQNLLKYAARGMKHRFCIFDVALKYSHFHVAHCFAQKNRIWARVHTPTGRQGNHRAQTEQEQAGRSVKHHLKIIVNNLSENQDNRRTGRTCLAFAQSPDPLPWGT